MLLRLLFAIALPMGTSGQLTEKLDPPDAPSQSLPLGANINFCFCTCVTLCASRAWHGGTHTTPQGCDRHAVVL